MEPSHYASDLDPSSVLGFGSALTLMEDPNEVGRLLTGALRSMGLADLQAVVLSDVLCDGQHVVGSVGTKALPDAVVEELRRIEADTTLDESAEEAGLSRRRIDVDDALYPALADEGMRQLSVLRLGTIEAEYGIVVAGHTDPAAQAPIEGSSLQMMAAQVSMALRRIQVDRERAEKAEALQESEARYRTLYENAPVAYVSVAPDGTIRMANERATQLLGASKDDLIGRRMPHFCLKSAEPADEDAAQQLDRHLRDGGPMRDTELQLCRADGEKVWVSLTMRPIETPAEEAERLVMMIDITERKRMEAALREAHDDLEDRVAERTEELQAANEQLQMQAERLEALREVDRAILSAESPREIATVAARRTQELVPCERVSVALFDWAAEQVTVLTAQQSEGSVLESGTSFPIEAFTLTERLKAGHIEALPDLSEAPSTAITEQLREAGIRSAITVPMRMDDTLIGTVNMGSTAPESFCDSERRIGRELADHLAIALRQSQLLEAVQEQREQLATLREIDQAILAAESPREIAAEAIRRVRTIVPYESATVTVIDRDPNKARLLAAVDNVLDAPTSLPLDEVYLSDNLLDGETEVISAEDYAPVPEAQQRMHEMGLRSILCLPMVVEGEVIGVIHIGRTEPDAFTDNDWKVGRELADHMAIALRQSRLLEAVQEQREKLEERVQERTAELESFTYSVSHDLRTPLRAIDGYSRILKEDHADQLDDEGRRLLNIIYDSAQTMGDQIDDLLTLSRVGRREMNAVPIDVTALAQETYDELARAQPDEIDAVTFDLQSLPKAEGDRSMLRHVFRNLVSNALKFTREEDEPRIEVGGEVQNGMAVYVVRDNGVGFDPEQADDMFGVFQRLHEDSDFEGTGVGLALVERVIRRHDGEVWAEGAEGEGAALFFSLPRPSHES